YRVDPAAWPRRDACRTNTEDADDRQPGRWLRLSRLRVAGASAKTPLWRRGRGTWPSPECGGVLRERREGRGGRGHSREGYTGSLRSALRPVSLRTVRSLARQARAAHAPDGAPAG